MVYITMGPPIPKSHVCVLDLKHIAVVGLSRPAMMCLSIFIVLTCLLRAAADAPTCQKAPFFQVFREIENPSLKEPLKKPFIL